MFKETRAAGAETLIFRHAGDMRLNRHSLRYALRTNPRAQVAFKDLMIRGELQVALLIAVRCVLHRHGNQDIHCLELYSNCFVKITIQCSFEPFGSKLWKIRFLIRSERGEGLGPLVGLFVYLYTAFANP